MNPIGTTKVFHLGPIWISIHFFRRIGKEGIGNPKKALIILIAFEKPIVSVDIQDKPEKASFRETAPKGTFRTSNPTAPTFSSVKVVRNGQTLSKRSILFRLETTKEGAKPFDVTGSENNSITNSKVRVRI